MAESTHAVAGSTPVVGCVYRGIVEERSGDGTYKVRIEAPRAELVGVLLAAPVFGGLLGYNIRCRLTPGTGVEVSYGSPSFIHAVIPRNSDDYLNAKNRSMMWGDVVETETGERNNFSEAPEDMVEGEVEIGNMFGIAMTFLTTLIKMSAGDRATVECHLINDMVRIISSQYRHFSGMGSELIFDHGRPTMERSWSSYRHEVAGALNEKDSIADMSGNYQVDRKKLEADRVAKAGRHRLIELIGFAGDFIHSFIADPPSTAAAMAGAAFKPNTETCSGKSLIHRNSDGTVLIQSVADIRLERVCRIPVPARIASHEDPTVTAERKYEELEAEFVKLPDLGKLADNNAFFAAYHIRTYSRWLSRYHAFARMLQLSDEYKVESEANTTKPSWSNLEKDKEIANAAIEYYDTYACITILRDGSIVTQDGYGASVVMSNGNLQLSAPRHIDMQAAGDIRVVAGNSIYLKARRNIEISAEAGGLILHSYAWFKGLCEKGSMWLRSNADTRAGASAPEPRNDGDPIPEVAGLGDAPAAMLFEAPRGNAVTRTDGQIVLMVDGGPADKDDDSKDIRIHTRGGATINGRRKVTIQSPTAIEISASRTVAIASSCIITSARQIIAGDGSLMYSGGKLYASRIESLSIKSNSVRSLSEKMSKIKPEDRVVPPEITNEHALEEIDIAKGLAANPPPIPWENASEGPLWSFSPREEYLWDARDRELGEMPETLTQQYLRVDVLGDPWGGAGYDTWTLDTRPAGGIRMAPGGGFGSWETLYQPDTSEGSSLRTPSFQDPKTMPALKLAWTGSGQMKIKTLKRS
jgi:hypothetical protein